jgi:succinate dehydrogenase / fumarate reductase cytochrome b subunit
MSKTSRALPNAFIWRRLHSFTGFFLVLFLIEHLLTNSQAALFFGDDGSGFISAVNSIHSLPYLEVIELFLIGAPLLIHMVWGIQYLRTSKINSYKSDGSTPSLGEYPRNRAYSWQRITSWILLIGIIAHVVQMRFVEYPVTSGRGESKTYMVKVSMDAGLPAVADRLNVQLSHAAADKQPLPENQVIAVAHSFGTASLLVVRDTFKSPGIAVLYTILVLAASFHAFNGLWTFLISWGIILTARAQQLAKRATTVLMILIAFCGLIAIWGTYWINLRQ